MLKSDGCHVMQQEMNDEVFQKKYQAQPDSKKDSTVCCSIIPSSSSPSQLLPATAVACFAHLLRDSGLALVRCIDARAHVLDFTGVVLILVRTPDNRRGEVGRLLCLATVAFLEPDSNGDDDCEADDQDNDHCDPAGVLGPPKS